MIWPNGFKYISPVTGQPADELILYTLRNSAGSEVSILNLGGTVTSLKMPDREGRLGQVVLGFARLEDYLEPHPYLGCLIGRYCNRIAGGRFSLQGTPFLLSQNAGQDHLHGGFRGFDKVIWQTPLQKDDDDRRLVLYHFSPDGDEGYPGNLQVQVVYSLSEDNRLIIDYTAETDATTIVNLTHHGYFNLGYGEDILAHQLKVQASLFTVLDDASLPTGEMRSVAGTWLDLRQPAMIGAVLSGAQGELRQGGLDHNFVLDRSAEGLALAASLYAQDSGRRLRVYSTEPGLQVYTGNDLGGRIFVQRAGICLEAQHFPDSPNQPGFPATTLRPGGVYRQTTIYQFDIPKEEEKI